MKVRYTQNLTGAPEKIIEACIGAAKELAHDAIEEVATDVRGELSSRQRDWIYNGEDNLLAQDAPKQLLESFRSYLMKLDVVVTHTMTESKLLVAIDGSRMSETGYSYEILARFMEYGGQITVGGKFYSIPPHPHWRSMLTAITRSVDVHGQAWLQRFIAGAQRRLLGALPPLRP